MRITYEHVRAARALARRAHAGQVDKAGRPYVEHPAAVAGHVQADHPVRQTVAWLHDVVEDTDVTLGQVRAQFGAVVADAVDALTHRQNERRGDYYARVRANSHALAVKEADLATNTDPWRTRLLEPADRVRLAKKYAHAYEVLGLLPPEPLVPDGRIAVTVGDFARRGPRDEVIVAWVGASPEDVTAVFTKCFDGQFRGTAAVAGFVQYHGIVDDMHVHSLPGDWTVGDPQWDLG